MRIRRLSVDGLVVVMAAAAILLLPQLVDLYSVINATIYVSMAVLALSLALIWGFGGILCFGQAAFFGIGGYTYAVAAINLGNSNLPVMLGILFPAIFATLLGYFMFWGRINNVSISVITFTVVLILFKFFNSTAGDAYNIGKAPLGGFNGIPSTPPLNLPWDRTIQLAPEQIWYVASTLLLLLYYGSRWLLSTHFGEVVVSIRENERRAGLLGYDVRRYKLFLFIIGSALAGASGILFANCVFVSPTMYSLSYNAQTIIWVIIGGVGTLAGPILACILLQMLIAELGTVQWLDPNFVLGVILAVFVLLVPKGLQPHICSVGGRVLAVLNGKHRLKSVDS